MDWGLKKIIRIYGLNLYNLYFIKFIKFLIKKGKLVNSFYMLNNLIFLLKKKFKINIHFIFCKIFFNLKPLIFIISKKIGLISYKFGIKILNEDKRIKFTIKWLIKTLRDKNKTRVLKIKVLNNLLYNSFFYKGLGLGAKYSYYNQVLDHLPFIRLLKYKQ